MSTAVAEPSDADAPPPAPEDPEEIVGYVRSASDVLRLISYVFLTFLLLAAARWAREGIVGIERDVVGLFEFVSTPAERLIAGAAKIAVALITLAVLVPPFITKRYRLLGYLLTGNILTGIFMSGATRWIAESDLPKWADAARQAGPELVAVHPLVLCQIICSFVILGPFVGLRWRRTGAVIAGLFFLAQLVVSPRLPTELLAGVALGAATGVLVLLAYGRPDQRPTVRAIADALRASGLPPTDLLRDPNPRSRSTAYFVSLENAPDVYTRVLSPEERSADLLFRAYRYVRLKNVGDERPFSSLRRSVEHEALVALLARDAGARTPGIRAVAGVGDESMLLVYERVVGVPLQRVEHGTVTDELLHELWRQLTILRAHGIAHRDLRQSNFIVDAAGDPWLIDFAFSEVAASERALATDVAQLLVTCALATDAVRAAAAAVAVLGREAVGTALPLLQPGALAGATRAALKHRKGLLDELRTAVLELGVDAPPALAQLERFSRRKVFTIATLALATYFLIPQFGNVGNIIDQVGDAQWWWFVPVMVMTVFTFVGATIAVMGSVNQRLPSVPTFLAQVASAFASKLAPAGLGGMALNTRFVQKAGVDAPVAVTSVGLNFVAGIVVHIGLLVVFAVWAGRDAFGSIKLPDPTVALLGLAIVAVIAAIGFAIPTVRRQITQRLFPIIGRAFGGLTGTLRHPTKVALLLAGSAFVTLSYMVALFFSIEAFGGSDLSFAQVGAIYLVATAIATLAPTPGGLGALEAAAIAGLVAAGMPNDIAVPSVFLFRLGTFWIPTVPGWAALTYLERADYL